VLNLLEQTEIKDRDLFKGGRPPVPLAEEELSDKKRQLDQQKVIEEAILKMNADRMLLSQRAGSEYQRKV